MLIVFIVILSIGLYSFFFCLFVCFYYTFYYYIPITNGQQKISQNSKKKLYKLKYDILIGMIKAVKYFDS